MAVRSTGLAKLSRPRLYEVLPRPRLFALLDDAATRPIVWVCAPPGAGKTTLVASYLEARNRRYVWYQADSGDADPAMFVHYMRAAALQIAGKAAAALPVFAPEPQQNVARFARSFFREFFAVLPRPCVVVFDNFQDMRPPSEGRVAFAQGLEEIPEGITLIIASRTNPPPEFARLVAGRRIARIADEALRCTGEEAEAIVGSEHLDRDNLQRFHQQSDGWVAALVLLREHLHRHGVPLEEKLGESRQAIFQYFAGEIFSGATPENQLMLMLTAIAPSITPQEAVAITGNEQAPRLLEYLCRRHLFTDRRLGEETSYHYHALFREFLLAQFRKRFTVEERRAASVRAAELLAKRGQVREALALFRDAGEWDAMSALIHANALDWARQGRAQPLSDWIEALPSAMREADPWLEYWRGRAWIFIEPHRGRPAVQRAYEAFCAKDDLRGRALALSAIVTSYYYEWANFAPLDRWLPELERLLGGERAAGLDSESELRSRAAWLIALLFRKPEDQNMEACARRLGELIEFEDDATLRVMAASTLLNYINWKTDGEQAAALVARITPILAKPEVTPLMQVWWRWHVSFWHLRSGRYAESSEVMTAARAIAERYGLEEYLFQIDYAETGALISKGEYAAAKARINEIERRLSPTRRMDAAYFHHLRSIYEQRVGQAASARQDAERAVVLGRETGVPALQMPHFLTRLAQACYAVGQRESAMRAADEAIALSSSFERRIFEQHRELLQIANDIDAGEMRRATAGLATVLAEYRARGAFTLMRNYPELASRFVNFALEHGIETEFVRTLIERNALAPPTDAADAWPFPLRIRVLGEFEIARYGEPLRFTGKAQQRPLDLLKLLVALGGSDVDAQQLTASLWPEADGAAAKTSFDTTLFRLRKLLDVDTVLVLAAGKLSLSPWLAWTDMRTLESAFSAASRMLDGNAAETSAARAARRLLEAYAGPLLGSEDEPWIVKPRDALRARVVRTLMRLGEQLEREQDYQTAIDVYRRGLEADNLAESLYRGLMRALAASGERAEALNAFRRCRELLSIVLGIKPSRETERLHREIVTGS